MFVIFIILCSLVIHIFSYPISFVLKTQLPCISYSHNSQSFYTDSSQNKTPYLTALIQTEKYITHRFFFPGHAGKRSVEYNELLDLTNMLRFDLPELEGTDNIHNPEGPLLEALTLAAELFGAFKTWFLINGSTVGILVAILSACKIYDIQKDKKKR